MVVCTAAAADRGCLGFVNDEAAKQNRSGNVAIIWRGEEERRFGMLLLQREKDLGMRRRKWEKWKKKIMCVGVRVIYVHTYLLILRTYYTPRL